LPSTHSPWLSAGEHSRSLKSLRLTWSQSRLVDRPQPHPSLWSPYKSRPGT
jgi:hypothetical protein